MMITPVTRDPSSQSNPDEATLTHLHWDLVVDFSNCTFYGTATYDVQILSPTTSVLRLDASGLDVRFVEVDGRAATFSLSVPDGEKKHLGSCLEIELGSFMEKRKTIVAGTGKPIDVLKVAITYATTDECSAAQWLPPAQTAGKKYPYVFTQCQAIHARTMVPCMDCPCVKMTYDASITVPSWATCVMSALSQNSTTDSTNSTKTYTFKQPVPIPSYLLALAVGELSSRDISPRCRVWSEPGMVDAVEYEFGQVEEFLKVGEELTLEYQWGRYDLLCLPPSFPYGGMENPCLTFVTPTLLAGDRSLADVVAHEAAHSWSGNLVTNATWHHFWLNEGWTIFLQRKIMTRIHGDPKFFDFDAIGGWESLKDDVKLLPEKYTKLVPDLGDGDPDDAFSSVPYEKGFNLLYSLEKIVGVKEFEGFTKAYFDKFKFGVVTSKSFREFFEGYFKDVDGIKAFDWEKWLFSPGMPETPDFDRTLSAECEGLADSWLSLDQGSGEAPNKDIGSWSSAQKICFLDAILSKCESRDKPLSITTVDLMKQQYSMQESSNSEVLFRFCMIAVASEDSTIIPIVVRFITSQGRMKFVRPLYRALFKSVMGKDIAVSTFLANKDFYHPIATKMVAVDLNVGLESTTENAKCNSSAKSCFVFDKRLLIGGLLVSSAAVGVALLRGKRK